MHSLKKDKLLFIFVLFLSFPFASSLAQSSIEENKNVEEAYVRVQAEKPSNQPENKKVLKLLKREKRQVVKVNKKIKDSAKGKNSSLSALETEIQSKTNQRIDSLSASIENSKPKKRGKKEKDKIATQGKDLRNKEIKKAKQEAIGKLQETEEVKELGEKMDKANINLPDSSNLLQNKTFRGVKDYSKLKDMSADSLADTVKTIVVEKAKERGTAEAMKIEEVAEGKQYLDQVKGYKNDSAAVDHLAEDLVNKTEYGKELGKLGGGQDGLQQANAQTEQVNHQIKEMQELQDKEQMKKYAKEKAAKLANGDLAKFAPQIQQAQQQFAQYKKKIELFKEGSQPNANSLKDEPLLKRLTYGGNFQVPEINPLFVVAAPFVGYRLNKKFTSGVSISYKFIVGKNTINTRSLGGEVGYRVFTDYKLIKNWFAHGEFERMSKTIENKNQEGIYTKWSNNGYIGIGRQLEIGKGLKMNVMFLCNILHKDLKYFDTDAFQFRLGVSR